MPRLPAWLLLCLYLPLLAGCAPAKEDSTPPQILTRAEAVAGDWNAAEPPIDGWTEVDLPDDWSKHWPEHDGVVWYRLHWQQPEAIPTGLLVPYVSLASAIRVNGSEIHRDPNLAEPISRGWTRPNYFLLDAPLLRTGTNEVTIRVSGLSAYQPGMRELKVGAPEALLAEYRSEFLLRHDLRVVSNTVGIVLGALFGVLWLLRRRDTHYGWFALSEAFFVVYGWNYIAESPWPFSDTDTWAAVNIATYLCSGICMSIFLLRYCNQRWPRTERLLLLLGCTVLLLAAFAPGYLGPHRNPWALTGAALHYAATIAFIIFAMRKGRNNHHLMAACFALQILVSLHDLALFFGLVTDQIYLLPVTSPLTLLAIGSVLVYDYARMLRRTESFNVELREKVDAATTELAATLSREHRLELDNTRIGERLNLVRDLHDGFGGTLLSAIAALEQPGTPSPQQLATILHEMNDDLRLIVDTTTHAGGNDLSGLLAPLRQRWTRRMDAAGIAIHWQVEAFDGLHLPPHASLELLRLLQEALTNVLKHSRAKQVKIVASTSPAQTLHVRVHDDGCGFSRGTVSGTGGAGLTSMDARARRLGSELGITSLPGQGTSVEFDLPL